ncbi:MAG: DUF1501 domain-containing protein [Deltaproteobacteria bacterium]|nr:DUF1501 domain-containing protein [Deltaproteobacteria bacterium]
MQITRRKLLLASSALGLTLLLPRRARIARARRAAPERFLLTLVAQGGLDTTMMFDARPLAMTAAGLVHNPLGEDPQPWAGGNGTTALTASTAAPLHALRDRFSVVNGVVMSTSFDGHDQNLNLLQSGNPFGGPSFNAEVNADARAPLDYVSLGGTFATLDDSRTIQLTPEGLGQLVDGASSLDGISPSLDEFLRLESEQLGNPQARFGAGVIELSAANAASRDLQQRIKAIRLGAPGDALDAQMSVVREVFRNGIARGAMFQIANDVQIDNHAAQSARTQAPTYATVCDRIARVFRYLAATPFDDTRSLLDVTTVVVGSEFGRTMRQAGLPIGNTGTDHNPLSNTILVGGSGVRTGLVLGASDFLAAGETLSGAHLALDPARVKVMGRPFDFASGTPRDDRPAAFAPGDYLQVASVVNTVYSLFDVPSEKWRLVARNGDVAPVLTQLIA